MTPIIERATRPIIFSGAMVRAILDGRKSQTRRIVKPWKHASLFSGEWADSYVLDPGNAEWRNAEVPYHPGQLLWVREAFNSTWGPETIYRADGGSAREAGYSSEPKWKPGIHMFRRLSRLTLEVTAVKVERLNDISREDVIAEGITERHGVPLTECVAGWHEPFAGLWTSINGPGSWEANPWIVAVTFATHRENIDQVIARQSQSQEGNDHG